nr:hypothetical protein [Tanacetum cinerariifolium]
MTKSVRNVNLPTEMKTSLTIPAGVQIARLASLKVIRVEISSGKPNFFQTESGIKLMLAPRSARALHLSSLKPYKIGNFTGSPSFSGNFLRITAEQFSLKGVFASSKSFSLLERRALSIFWYFGIRIKASARVMIRDIEVKRIPLMHNKVYLRRRFGFLDKKIWDIDGILSEILVR